MNISFTEKQIKHAQVVVIQLVKRRFFIDIDESEHSKFSYFNCNEVLIDSLAIQEELFSTYKTEREKAEKNILDTEKSLGFSLPEVPKDRTIVQCNKYTSGFDIKSVFPLSFLLDDSMDKQTIFQNILKGRMGSKTLDDFSPKEMKKSESHVSEISKKVLDQWGEVQSKDNFENLCVVLMESRFRLSGGPRGGDFAESKLDGIEKYPELLGYLFYQKSKSIRFVSHDHIVFNTSRAEHVGVSPCSNGELNINYSRNGGYDGCAQFAAIF